MRAARVDISNDDIALRHNGRAGIDQRKKKWIVLCGWRLVRSSVPCAADHLTGRYFWNKSGN